jgi:sodium-dependent phosphate cotransporter
MIIGACIGTTCTGLIAAFANMGEGFKDSLQVALSHVFFNVIGMVLWFMIPVLNKLPIKIALFAGRKTEKYRWWAGMAHFFTEWLFEL